MVCAKLSPLAAANYVATEIRRNPGRFAGYFAVRALIQFVGGAMMTLAAIPCLIGSSILSAPVLGVGGALAGSLGGWNAGAGAAVGSATILLAATVFYCLTCAALLPLTAVPYLLADRMLATVSPP